MNKFKFLCVSLLVCVQMQAMYNENELNVALFHCAEQGDLSIMNKIINAKADVNFLYYTGKTPLIAAASKGQLSCMRALIAANAQVNYATTYSGDTALIQAAFYNHLPCLQALIAAKANIHHTDSFNKDTALTWAAKMDHFPICEALVEAMLHQPNDKQKKAMTVFLGLNKYRNTLGFLGLGKNFACILKPHLCTAIYDQNKQNFQNSIAYQEVNKLENGPTKKHLLEKYSNKPDTNTVNNANQNE